MINLEFFSQAIFYNLSPFTICFALFLFVAGVRFAASFEQKRPVIFKAVWLGIAHQYVLLPICAFFLTWLLQTSAEVSLAIFLLVSFPSNRFSLMITWIAGGSTLFSVVMGLISILCSVTITPFIFYGLMHVNPMTQSIFVDHPYSSFIALFWDNRLRYFLLIVIAVGLGMLARNACKEIIQLTETKMRWVALLFVSVYMVVIILQQPDYFFDYWHFFSWEVLLFNVGVLLLSFAVARLFRLSKPLTIAFVLSSAKNLIPVMILVILAWYAQFKAALWLVAVQATLTQWFFLVLILLVYKLPRAEEDRWK